MLVRTDKPCDTIERVGMQECRAATIAYQTFAYDQMRM